jgi:hypothetical protein
MVQERMDIKIEYLKLQQLSDLLQVKVQLLAIVAKDEMLIAFEGTQQEKPTTRQSAITG